MTSYCIRQTDLPGTSALFADFLYDFARVNEFYDHDPQDPASLTRSAQAIDYPAERRSRITEALRALNPNQPAAIEKFSQPGTVAVLTGQQVGLYGGPGYTLYKALTAVRLAQQLTEQGQPAVPIFWLATEDHDVEEIRSALFWDAELKAAAASDGRPAGNHLLAGLPHSLPLSEHLAALAERHYQNGKTFGEAFRGLMEEVLGPFGLLIADPLDPQLRSIGAEFLSSAARNSAALTPALADRGRALLDAGYHAQVHFDRKQTSLFFLLDGGKRKQLRFDGTRYSAGTESWTPEQLAEFGAALSPNALLRPVWQDWLFPTVALIGGPGELAYFAQSQVLYRALLGRMPVMLPRAFFTLVDSKSAKIISNYRVRFESVLGSEESVRQTLAERLVPPALVEGLDEAKRGIETAIANLETRLAIFDPTLKDALSNSQRKIQYQFEKNRTKIVREMLRKSEQAQRQAAHLSHRLSPHGHLQERSYSMLAMMDEFGPDFPQFILDNIHPGCHDHHVIVLG